LAEKDLTHKQRAQLEGIDPLDLQQKVLFVSCHDCNILDKHMRSTLEGKEFIVEHAGHRTSYYTKKRRLRI